MLLEKMISKGENSKVEFKSSFNQETIESVCAFANKKGGTIFVGLKSLTKVHGVQIGEESVHNRYLSTLRNKAIANHFHLLGEIEKYGSGVTRVIQLFRDAGLQEPKFEILGGGLKVTVSSKKVADKVADKVTDKPEKQSPARARLLSFVKQNPGCSIGDMMNATGFSDSYVRKNLSILAKEGEVEHRGSRKTGGYYAE